MARVDLSFKLKETMLVKIHEKEFELILKEDAIGSMRYCSSNPKTQITVPYSLESKD